MKAKTKKSNIFYIAGLDDDVYGKPLRQPRVYRWIGAGIDYLVREIKGLWLFRSAHSDVEEWTYYLFQDDENPADVTEATFDATVTNGDFGRFVVHRIPMTRYEAPDLCHLCLAPNGNGIAVHERDIYSFRWEPEWSHGDIRSLGSQDMEGVCTRIFQEKINPILRDPYFSPEERDASQSIEFICGSEDELARVTTWIIHSEPNLFFDMASGGNVVYFATVAIEGEEHTSGLHRPQSYSHRIRKLTELAFEYNAFTGIYWEYQDMSDDRRSGWEAQPQAVSVSMQNPSAHERAEALLQLADWLKGKVPEDERRALLGANLSDKV